MNNFKFRSHRGGFEESMSTVVEVSNIDELLAHINKSRRSNDEIHSVNLSYSAYDSRNGWDTYYVSIPGEGVVGFINGDPTKTDEAPASGADRLNAGKLQWSLVDFTALEPMVRVLMKGAQKYSPENWKNGLSYTSILDSTMRHMTAFKAGEDLDPETGEPHTAHMLCNLMFLAWEELNRKDLDNRKPDLK